MSSIAASAPINRPRFNIVRALWMLVALVLATDDDLPAASGCSRSPSSLPTEVFKPNLLPAEPTAGQFPLRVHRGAVPRATSPTPSSSRRWSPSPHSSSTRMAGYALARLRFPGRETIFVLIFSTFLVSLPVIIVPLFILVRCDGDAEHLRRASSYRRSSTPSASSSCASTTCRCRASSRKRR